MKKFIEREVRRLDGLFYGTLSEEEREVVDEAIKLGLAERRWDSAAGYFLGLSKVRVL